MSDAIDDEATSSSPVAHDDACVRFCRDRFGIHYGFVALVLSCLVMLASSPGHSFGVAAFVDHWIQDLSIPRTQVSFFWACATFVCAPLLPVAGAQVDRCGVSRMLRYSFPVFGLVLLWLSTITHAWQLCLAIITNRLITADILPLIAGVHLNKWFVVHRGKANAVFNVINTLMALFPALAGYFITAHGWRTAYVLTAMLLYIMLAPAVCLIRDSPEVCGLLPDLQWRDRPEAQCFSMPRGTSMCSACINLDKPGSQGTGDVTSWEINEILRSWTFWVLMSGAMVSAEGAAMNFHMIDIVRAVGLSEDVAAQVFFIESVASFVSGLFAGVINDILEQPHRMLALANALVTIAFTVILLAPDLYALWAGLLGTQQGISGSICAIVFVKYFGQKHMGKIMGIVSGFMLLVAGVGPMAFGYLADRYDGLQGYRRCFLFFILANCLSCLMVSLLKRPESFEGLHLQSARRDVVADFTVVGKTDSCNNLDDSDEEILVS